MEVIDQIRDLSSRIQNELVRGSNYYHHTTVAWRFLQRLVAEGRRIEVRNVATGESTDGRTLAALAQGYVTEYLAESVFQHYISLLEDYLFGLIGAWLMAHPKGIVGLDEDESDDKLKKSERTVPLSFITDNPDRESILRAVVDRELDRLKYKRLALWFDYLEKRARLGVPSKQQIEQLAEMKASRDVLVHNRGIVNQAYLLKAGSTARFADGARLEITAPYLRDSRLLLTEVVQRTSEKAIEKLGRTAVDGAADSEGASQA
jgi:hypothetical protein